MEVCVGVLLKKCRVQQGHGAALQRWPLDPWLPAWSAREGNYPPAGATSTGENSAAPRPPWSALSLCWPRTAHLFFSKLESVWKHIMCGNSKFISEPPLAVCMNKVLLTGVTQGCDRLGQFHILIYDSLT